MEDAKQWLEVRREVVGIELENVRYDVESVVYGIIVDIVFRGGQPMIEQVKEARMKLNLAHGS